MGVALQLLGGNCGLLCDSCGCPEPPRRDAHKPLELRGELALVREARSARCQRSASPQIAARSCGEVQALDRHDRHSRRVEVERLGGDLRDQPRLPMDGE
jgi:hypothetical protein